jgi:hypothetical protein
VNRNPNAGGLLCALACMAVMLAAVLAIYIFFCLTLQRTQTEVHPRNRLIPPGTVWLHLLHLAGAIPLVGIVFGLAASVWDIVMVVKLSGSLKLEFEDRGWRTDGEGFGRVTGLVWSVGQLAGLPLGFAIGFLGPQVKEPAVMIAVLVALAGLGITLLICWIVYWVQMAGYGKRLREGHRGYRTGSIEDDYDDEFRAPRRAPGDGDPFDFDDDAPRRRRPADEDDDDRPRRRDDLDDRAR